MRIRARFPGVLFEEQTHYTRVAVLNSSSGRKEDRPCAWTEINVKNAVQEVFKHMAEKSGRRDLRFFIHAGVLRGNSTTLRHGRVARRSGVDKLPVLALWSARPLDAEIVAHEEERFDRQKRHAGNALCRRGSLCGSTEAHPCRPTRNSADGSLELVGVRFRLHISEVSPIYTATYDAQNSPNLNTIQANRTGFTTYQLFPKALKFTVHRCKGSCRNLPIGRRAVPIHFQALNYFKAPNEVEREGLCCRPKRFADHPSSIVRMVNDPEHIPPFFSVRLKRIHAKACECLWT